jgi:crossover junction endodeoxyribonuclease RuvC
VFVLGIDPGSHQTGWGMISSVGTQLKHIDSGVIQAQGDVLQRLDAIAAGLEKVLEKHQPDAVVVESLFHHKNSRSALTLGHARGVALLCVARSTSRFFEYAPAEIKRATTGNGRASKQLVGQMVGMLLGHGNKLQHDESDALAAAICHTQCKGARLR